jgi:hypothetical protein
MSWMGQIKNACTVLCKNLKGGNHLGEIDVDGKDNIKLGLQETAYKKCHRLMWLNM